MIRNVAFIFAVLICMGSSVWAQKPKVVAKKATKSSTPLSRAEKMGYERTNKHWGPGTYYAYAPGVTHAKMVNTQESAIRDLTGISREDCITELTKQGFVAVPPKEVQKWYGNPKNKAITYFYAPGKSYVLQPTFTEMEMSSQPGDKPFAVSSVTRSYLVPKQDSLKVLEMVWQYMRDLKDMKVLMTGFSSTFKKADAGTYPFMDVSSASGWNTMRAGTLFFNMVNGKAGGIWNRNEDIVRRTIGNPGFTLNVQGLEIDFEYSMHVLLQKEGYVVVYELNAPTMKTLHAEETSEESTLSWAPEHKRNADDYSKAESYDKQAIELYKKTAVPPVLEDLDKLLHIQ